MYNSNTDSLGWILDVEVFFSIGHCSGALCCTNNENIARWDLLVSPHHAGICHDSGARRAEAGNGKNWCKNGREDGLGGGLAGKKAD